jgi:hypothetical protein
MSNESRAFTNRNVVFAKPGRHYTGTEGLYLYVSPDEQVRRWIYRYTSPVSRRMTETGFGLVSVVTLGQARAELWPKVGDGMKGKGGVSWGCLTPPLLHRRSDTP